MSSNNLLQSLSETKECLQDSGSLYQEVKALTQPGSSTLSKPSSVRTSNGPVEEAARESPSTSGVGVPRKESGDSFGGIPRRDSDSKAILQSG